MKTQIYILSDLNFNRAFAVPPLEMRLILRRRQCSLEVDFWN